MINKKALLAHLRARADHPKPIIGATYAGLATRIERGDFDEKEGGSADGEG
ncbi:hypothetical protein [Cryobacterium soli]|uniref:hypothetical protein n=1 Tax=Cryobacterium soli TaxID=2220095 RepID=UPI001C658B33|nr:hypothetical protein [Cryobacterium soli]